MTLCVDLEYYNAIPPHFRSYQKCIHCLGEFLELDNIGRLNCRFHPGVLVKSLPLHEQEEPRYVYSCCGVDHMEKTIGCLLCDHISDKCGIELSVVVDVNNAKEATRLIRERLARIKSFAIAKMPHYLFKTKCFKTPQHQQIISNVSSSTSSSQINRVQYELNAIKQVRRNSYELMQIEQGMVDNHLHSSKSIFTEHDHEDPDSDILSFDLHNIGHQIKLQSLDSVVFQLYQAKEAKSDHKNERSANNIHHMNRLLEKTNSIWKDDLRNKEGQSNLDNKNTTIMRERMNRNANNDNNVPFYIIQRIDNSISITYRTRY